MITRYRLTSITTIIIRLLYNNIMSCLTTEFVAMEITVFQINIRIHGHRNRALFFPLKSYVHVQCRFVFCSIISIRCSNCKFNRSETHGLLVSSWPCRRQGSSRGLWGSSRCMLCAATALEAGTAQGATRRKAR